MYSIFIHTHFEANIAQQIAAAYGFETLSFWHRYSANVLSPWSGDQDAHQASKQIYRVLTQFHRDRRDNTQRARIQAQYEVDTLRDYELPGEA